MGFFDLVLNIPYIKAWVKNSFIKTAPEGYTECYIHSLTALKNRPHLLNIHTVDGAVYSRLPIQAFFHKPPTEEASLLAPESLEPWGVIGDETQVIQLRYLKDYFPRVLGIDTFGRYLFSVEALAGGFAEDPEQSKTLHMLALENGQFALLPNNSLLFRDRHFTEDPTESQAYKRNTEYFHANG